MNRPQRQSVQMHITRLTRENEELQAEVRRLEEEHLRNRKVIVGLTERENSLQCVARRQQKKAETAQQDADALAGALRLAPMPQHFATEVACGLGKCALCERIQKRTAALANHEQLKQGGGTDEEDFPRLATAGVMAGFLEGVRYANLHYNDEQYDYAVTTETGRGDPFFAAADPDMLYMNFCESDESDIPDLTKCLERVVARCNQSSCTDADEATEGHAADTKGDEDDNESDTASATGE